MLLHQKDSAKFRESPYLLPTEKGAAPFRLWCLDLITDLKPPAPDGSTDIVVAVDPFTRWMEIALLPTRSSADVNTWFHDQVVCRYGTPTAVQSDHGNKFKGDFKAYLKAWGV